MKVKRKGAYQYESLGWHQNQGGLVIPMAAEAFMLHGTPLDEFIRNHKNPFDFCMRTKVPRSSKLYLIDYTFDEADKMILDHEGEPLLSYEVQQQNVCRYYTSPGGKFFRKVMPPVAGKTEDRNFGIESGYRCKVCNNMKDFDWDIDYEYYIKEAEKLVIQ